ncbi:acid protease [Fomitiporia mediterranea MF3/22]|uniref:acid protease n=1 Tax=Fomitiporia mediterranea (strain MF3/22) TaxID=694068 RepID=UPI0004407AEC|nr:acid protease [Fomitiporia mediterranea MF3/22]EJD06630.1 acid protease [Fomitiporia mediterranea MF3/22]
MQLFVSFSTLLTSLLLAISLTGDVDARPAKRDAGTITLPLKRMTQARSDIHPQILLQQHMNRGTKRLARMSGRAAPSELELRENIHKRMYIPAGGRKPLAGKRTEKRYNRQGVVPMSSKPANQANSLATSSNDDQTINYGDAVDALNEIVNGGNDLARKHKNKNGGAGGAINGAGGANNGATGGGNATGGGANSGNSSSTSGGISQADINAALGGGLTPADQPSAPDTLGLDIEANDVGYIATVQIGTPGADFKVLMDSGSADFWVGGENCQSEDGGGCGNHTFLGTGSSSSFVDTGKQFQVTYGSGEVQGNIITDNVNFAGLNLTTHTFGVATTESVQFSSDQTTFDGLMGLAQSTLSEQGVLTPVESLAKDNQINGAITSFKLGRVADGNNDGQVTFGGLDTSKFDQATLTTLNNVNTQGFWEGAMDAVTVGGQDLGLTGRTAILDTGTTLIIAPTDDANAVHAAIPGAKSDGQGGFTLPCTSSSQVALSFGGRSFAIDPRDLLFLPVDQNDPTGDCVSGISSGQIGGANEWLVGDVFLKNVYFSTDVDKNQIQLANLA